MYRQEAFAEDRTDVLLSAMREIGFAALVTPTSEGVEATHTPMLVRETSDGVVLESHVARANPHWRALGPGARSLAVFQGPNSYVTPSWYASKAETGKVAPTWVYIAVHAHGPLRPVHDETWLRRHIEDLTALHEGGRPAPWSVDDAPETYLSAMMRGGVGVELAVERLEGVWKLNQHKPTADRDGTRRGLAASGPMGAALADALDAR